MSGERNAAYSAPKQRRQQAVAESDAEARERTQHAAGEINRARRHAIGQGYQRQHARHIAARHHAGEPASLGVAQRPGRDELRQQSGDQRETGQAQDLSRADGHDQARLAALVRSAVPVQPEPGYHDSGNVRLLPGVCEQPLVRARQDGGENMRQGQIGMTLDISGYETALRTAARGGFRTGHRPAHRAGGPRDRGDGDVDGRVRRPHRRRGVVLALYVAFVLSAAASSVADRADRLEPADVLCRALIAAAVPAIRAGADPATVERISPLLSPCTAASTAGRLAA